MEKLKPIPNTEIIYKTRKYANYEGKACDGCGYKEWQNQKVNLHFLKKTQDYRCPNCVQVETRR